MTTTPHPYANILHAIADGKNVQWQDPAGEWINQSHTDTMVEISEQAYSPARYRVHVKTIRINGHQIDEPLREMPPDGTTVYWPGFGPDSGDTHAECADVGCYPTMLPELLREGLLHDTQEAASAHATAILSFTVSK